jgi:hypothetical protein
VQATRGPADLPTELPDLHVRAQTPQELSEELTRGLRQLRALVTVAGATALSPKANPDFDVLHPNCCQIIVLNKQWRTWGEALDEVGQKFQLFRSRRSPDYQNVKDVLSGRSKNLSTVHRAAFGLPIVFYSW